MPQKNGISNEPGRYDQARVELLKPVEAAVKKLQLPLIRERKVGAILNALEMQIEDGGDSPDVNRLLLDALRAGIRHQVDEGRAQAVFRAIDAFEQAEAKRWDLVTAGPLSPVAWSPLEQLDDLMKQGYKLLEARQSEAVCDRWLEAWELVKQMTRPEFRTTTAFDEAHPGLSQCLFNWCQDLEMELSGAGVDNPAYNEHRLRYAREFLSLFPDEDANFHVNFVRAQGESLWRMERRAEAEEVYRNLVERFPDEAWGYIGWADNYWLYDDSSKEYDRAEAILKRGLARPNLNDRDNLLERLEDLYAEWGKPERQAAIAAQRKQLAAKQQTARSLSSILSSLLRPSARAPQSAKKLSRNAPCWCGSGKKYKKCHLQSDEDARR